MPNFHRQMPVAVQFGWGVTRGLAEALKGRPCVVLAFAQAEELGLRQAWAARLGPQLASWITVPDGLGTLGRARELAATLWPRLLKAPDTVLLGLGGGTVMDLAKLLRFQPASGDFEALVAALRGSAPWPAMSRCELWLLPTTAGTGSEVTRWATVWDTDHGAATKRSFDEPFGWADRALVDPELTLGCPSHVRRDTALDALAHALEAIWNVNANPVSDSLALAAARQIIATLPDALADPESRKLRCDLSLAALNAGMAFSQTRTALAHALSYAVTLEQGLPHGLACAIWLPAAWRMAIGTNTHVDHLLGSIFRTTAEDGASQLEAWLSCVGVEANPLVHGIFDGSERIQSALGSERGRNFIAVAGPHLTVPA